jgi:predicted nucleotidyltransferase
MQPDARVIDQLIQQIVAAVHPLRIVLFGSAARGEMGPNSDFDVMVVMPNGTHRRKTAQTLYREVEGVSVPFDAIVATPEDLDRYSNSIGLVYRTVLEEGVVIYAQ